ncbi:hypothetical protein O3G_MSEX011080 [Manduca sexta]|nr:hypothetical protein O3G_MSEX011080 [Manduca sexta]
MTEWSGSASLRKTPLPGPVNIVIIQHAVTPTCATDVDCQNFVNAIRQYQMGKLHFDDIGPSFLVGDNGKVYEGAGWDLVGAHTLGYNNRAIGISFIGEFTDKLPSAEAMEAAKNLIACGVDQKHLTADYHLVGHRQLTLTQSPGDALQKEIQSWPHWLDNAKETLN